MNEVTYPEEITLTIPPPLQTLLENDCIEITQRKRLVILPTSLSVETILKDYYRFACSQNNNTNTNDSEENVNYSLLIEVLDGIKIYFDFTLKDHLLYEEEKDQYRNITDHVSSGHMMSNGIENQSKATPSSLYGAIHLLRLFAKLPQFLSHAKFSSSHTHILHHYFKDIIRYLSLHLDVFVEKYNLH